MKYRLIFLDFDGVLVESNAIKDNAFEHVFADHAKHMPEILDYHKRTTAIRFEKFRHIVANILHEEYTPARERQLAEGFSKFCIDQVIRCPWVKGAQEFLEFFDGKVPMCLVTINPQEDLDAVLKGRNMAGYFKDIRTVTGSKTAAITAVLAKFQLAPPEAVFIGDSDGDRSSAQNAGVDFIGRNSGQPLAGTGFPRFNDMIGVLEHLHTVR